MKFHQEVENPMLSPEPRYSREGSVGVELDLTDHYKRMDALNRKLLAQWKAKDAEAAKETV